VVAREKTAAKAPRAGRRTAARAAPPEPASEATPSREWTFLTNHAHVLLCLAAAGPLTARELSSRVGITERAVQSILADLIAGDYLRKSKVGRRNDYTVNARGRLRHPLESAHTVGELIDALT
jgi:predicted HTH transcriptional regulator